ncbi:MULTISPECIES: hypothetical protein [unclassified Bradyrhizobium]|uniref:hypothetical protein n=1 Tax=unclassified Bradyrhizobium TaxID=2631580 RepID=UPI002305A364|nr:MULTISPECIES: hypothetical protein [unclassified Bradyrhizobium]MDA9451173.1 hypothetical protein [Bradyrhizobium sp. CCBAU 21360]MDA9457552.1 hypothetical protein [Bradyrhizobium sp. CCBAU 21359]
MTDAGATGEETARISSFDRVYDREYRDIRSDPAPEDLSASAAYAPTTDHLMTGLALSGGGVRSASFSLGVLQALHAAGKFKGTIDYLSTVSGGGYIGTSTTVSMSYSGGQFPFGRTGHDPGETEETGHIRDNSRYLLQNGIGSAISAAVIYLRGTTMNAIVLMPFLLAAAAALILANPDTRRLLSTPGFLEFLPASVRSSGWAFTFLAGCALAILLIVYAIGVSVFPILKKEKRQAIAKVAAIVLAILVLPLVFELHFWVLRHMFGISQAPVVVDPSVGTYSKGQVQPSGYFDNISRLVTWLTPLVLGILPFVRPLAEKAISGAESGLIAVLSKWASRLVLIVVAAIGPLIIWLAVLQLAYWGIGVSSCQDSRSPLCTSWAHAPGFLGSLFGYDDGRIAASVYGWSAFVYIGFAVGFLGLWPFLNVNSNSLHQLYRDRLGGAFLFRRSEKFDAAGKAVLEGADDLKFSEVKSGAGPYHIINTALNVPGSSFANKRGRNADFFSFSKHFVGSEATGYVPTALVEKVTDGLNIGTAMAISGAAAAPNMGMASMRPLSPTIALLNVRLGRWLRHPADIRRLAKAHPFAKWWLGKPGPMYLLREAFFKSGATVSETGTPNEDGGLPKSAGFVFLTDGGHIENLGIYELLRRRCQTIIAVDGEADESMAAASLVQLQRFARIDLGTIITMEWQPIAERTRLVSQKIKAGERSLQSGPHVALGLIDYPPLPRSAVRASGEASVLQGSERQRGVLIYIKASLSGDENDYVSAYKAANPTFPHETTMDQLFSEEQLECYRALGEHIGRRMISGEDKVAVSSDLKDVLLSLARRTFPDLDA